MGRTGTAVYPVIVLNYLCAAALGFSVTGGPGIGYPDHSTGYYQLAACIGILFISMFFLLARSTRQAGMGITTIASKMSVVFPMLFSIVYEPADPFNMLKGLGIFLTLTGVLLTIYKGKTISLNDGPLAAAFSQFFRKCGIKR